ncbi:MAG: YceI family protein [Bacteroidota bacterium]
MQKLIAIVVPLQCLFLLVAFSSNSSMREVFPDTPPGTLTFIGDAGSPNVFTVEKWKFSRVENLENPSEIGITAVLDMRSITCDWEDLQRSLHRKKEYFNSRRYQTAMLIVDGAELQEDGSYLTEAMLELKGKRKSIPITFTLGENEEGVPTVEAESVVMRRNWSFNGGGPKDEVPVTVSAELVEFTEE